MNWCTCYILFFLSSHVDDNPLFLPFLSLSLSLDISLCLSFPFPWGYGSNIMTRLNFYRLTRKTFSWVVTITLEIVLLELYFSLLLLLLLLFYWNKIGHDKSCFTRINEESKKCLCILDTNSTCSLYVCVCHTMVGYRTKCI